MNDSQVPVPDKERLPDDPLHPSGERLQVEFVAAEPSPSGGAVAIDLRGPRKTDPRTRKEVYVTRRFLLSPQGARLLIREIHSVLDQV